MRRSPLNAKESFFYLNGDSLFFPSSFESLARFKKSFMSDERSEGWFFAAPPPPEDRASQLSKGGYLWADRDSALRAIGSGRKIQGLGFSAGAGEHLKTLKPNELAPLKFSGLAAFKGSFLSRLSEKNLKPKEAHIFHNVIEPLLEKRLFKVFADISDQGGLILEGGEKSGFLRAAGLAMDALFSEARQGPPGIKAEAEAGEKNTFWLAKKPGIKLILESLFQRFDPDDELAGLKSGKKRAAEHGTPLLAPASVRGLSHLKAEGFAVIGPGAALSGPSFLKESVLGAGVCWRGALEKNIIIKFSA